MIVQKLVEDHYIGKYIGRRSSVSGPPEVDPSTGITVPVIATIDI